MPAAYSCIPATEPLPEAGRCQAGYVEAAPVLNLVAEFPPVDVGAGAFAIGFIAAVSMPRVIAMVIREIARLVR